MTEIKLRVRYGETDQMGVAYYGSYAVWLEVARTEYCRERGVDYRKIEEEGLGLVVTELYIKYLKPLRYDDEIRIMAWIDKVGKYKLTFRYKIHKEEILTTQAFTKHVFIDMISRKPTTPPAGLVKSLTKEANYG